MESEFHSKNKVPLMNKRGRGGSIKGSQANNKFILPTYHSGNSKIEEIQNELKHHPEARKLLFPEAPSLVQEYFVQYSQDNLNSQRSLQSRKICENEEAKLNSWYHSPLDPSETIEQKLATIERNLERTPMIIQVT